MRIGRWMTVEVIPGGIRIKDEMSEWVDLDSDEAIALRAALDELIPKM